MIPAPPKLSKTKAMANAKLKADKPKVAAKRKAGGEAPAAE